MNGVNMSKNRLRRAVTEEFFRGLAFLKREKEENFIEILQVVSKKIFELTRDMNQAEVYLFLSTEAVHTFSSIHDFFLADYSTYEVARLLDDHFENVRFTEVYKTRKDRLLTPHEFIVRINKISPQLPEDTCRVIYDPKREKLYLQVLSYVTKRDDQFVTIATIVFV
jgi:hypothetical protein